MKFNKNYIFVTLILFLWQTAKSRYLEYISYFEDSVVVIKNLLKISEKKYLNERSFKGFNFFDSFDSEILLSLRSGEFNINGFRNKTFKAKLKNPFSYPAVTRILKRLLQHGMSVIGGVPYKVLKNRLS